MATRKPKPGEKSFTVPTQGFATEMPDWPTSVHVHKLPNGVLGLLIETKREGEPPAVTQLALFPHTATMVQAALFRAQHHPNPWLPIKPPAKKRKVAAK